MANECPICMNEYNYDQHYPHALYPCGHTFCSECIPNFTICPLDNQAFSLTIKIPALIKSDEIKKLDNETLTASNLDKKHNLNKIAAVSKQKEVETLNIDLHEISISLPFKNENQVDVGANFKTTREIDKDYIQKLIKEEKFDQLPIERLYALAVVARDEYSIAAINLLVREHKLKTTLAKIYKQIYEIERRIDYEKACYSREARTSYGEFSERAFFDIGQRYGYLFNTRN